MPRKFEANNFDDRVLYDEEEDVPEMYFIINGVFGIGFSQNNRGINDQNYHISKEENGPFLICDHYVVNNCKSQFLYLAIEDVSALALSKKFLFEQVFSKYPDITAKIKDESRKFYVKYIYNIVNEDRLN